MARLIECRNLVKSYGRVRAINDLTFDVDSGPPIGLVGPNGAGKTTLFSLISGFLTADSGTVRVDGIDADSSRRNGIIGILPQDAPFLKGIRVRNQLDLFARLQGMSAREAIEVTRTVTTDFGVADLLDRKPEHLSHGQRKRIALAQSIIGRPKLVLLDEPTSGLDPVVADDVRRLIQSRAHAITFMISSHNLAELEDICETIIVINEGRLVVATSVAELRGRDQRLRVRLTNPADDAMIARLGRIEGVVDVTCANNDLKQIIIRYDCMDPDRLQMEVLGLMQAANLPVVELSQGGKLAEGILRLVRDKK